MSAESTSALEQLRRLWRHAEWADAELLSGLRTTSQPVALAVREYAHVIATEEAWLARLEGRPSRVPVWPKLDLSQAAELAVTVRDGYVAYLDRLEAAALEQPVAYVNSVGQAFTTPVNDILLHVALHGQYHRGKINLLLRQADERPAPTDYIAFVRGVPAARTQPQ